MTAMDSTHMLANEGAVTFSSQGELVAAQLELVRARIRIAIAQRARGAEKASLPSTELDEAEACVIERARASQAAGVSLPLLWLEDRLGLELAALRVFAAASANRPLSNQLLSRAAQLEYQAMGRVMPSTL